MELQHAFAFSTIVIDMQQERLGPNGACRDRFGEPRLAPYRTRGLVPKFIAGVLVLLLVVAAVAPAFAEGPHHHKERIAQSQEQDVAAAKVKH